MGLLNHLATVNPHRLKRAEKCDRENKSHLTACLLLLVLVLLLSIKLWNYSVDIVLWINTNNSLSESIFNNAASA